MISIQQLYTTYMNHCNQLKEPDFSILIDDPHLNQLRPLTDQEFEWTLQNDEKFNAEWGLNSHRQIIQYLLEKEGDMANKRHWANLTEEQALFIKDLRVGDGHSWRSVARHFIMEYGLEETVTQFMGAMLCEAARKVLGESVEDGWN